MHTKEWASASGRAIRKFEWSLQKTNAHITAHPTTYNKYQKNLCTGICGKQNAPTLFISQYSNNNKEHDAYRAHFVLQNV